MALSCISSLGQAPTEDTGLNLSLDDCLRIALSSNPTIKVADKEIERCDYSKIETLSQLLPQASFTGNYSRMLAKQVMYMNMDFDFGSLPGAGDGSAEGDTPANDKDKDSKKSGGSGDGIKVGLDNSYQIGFSASMPIIAPQLWATLKLSDNQILQAVESSRASKLDLVNNVKSAFYTMLFALDSKKVIQESYDMAKFTYDLYSKQQEVGAASEYDVLRTSVAMKNIEPQLTQADVAIKQARLQLLLLMGIDSSTDFSISGSLNSYEKTMYEDVMAIGRDFSGNSSLILNDLQRQALEQSVKVEKYSLYPTLAASFNYNWTSMSNGSPFKNFRWNPYSMVGLSLNIPLFTGGKRYSRIKAAEVQVQQMKWNRENLERSVSTQVDLAIDNINVNVKQIASCAQSVGQAEKAHDIMEQSFAIGAASYLNLRDSELALTQSRLTYLQAIYNYLVARSQLELLLGNAPIEQYK